MNESNFSSCFVLNGTSDWKKSSVDDWDLDVIEINGSEKLLGHKQLDGAIFKILQTVDDKIVAITKNN